MYMAHTVILMVVHSEDLALHLCIRSVGLKHDHHPTLHHCRSVVDKLHGHRRVCEHEAGRERRKVKGETGKEKDRCRQRWYHRQWVLPVYIQVYNVHVHAGNMYRYYCHLGQYQITVRATAPLCSNTSLLSCP